MEEQKMSPGGQLPHGSGEQSGKSAGFDFGLAIALGLGLGVGLGALLENVATGMVVGLALATVANAFRERRLGKKGAGTALVIALGGLAIMVLILALSRLGWPGG